MVERPVMRSAVGPGSTVGTAVGVAISITEKIAATTMRTTTVMAIIRCCMIRQRVFMRSFVLIVAKKCVSGE